MGLFLAAALVVFTIVYFNSTNLLVRQTDETIEAEIRGLDEQYARGGIASLVETVRARSRRPGDGLYFVGDARGRHLVGNLDRVPEATPSAGGWVDFDVFRSAATDNQDAAFAKQAARARVFILAEGVVLLVGRNIQARKEIEAVIETALVWGLVATLVLGVAGGLLAGRRMLRRIDAASAVTREIITGDLTRRLPISGSGDELDRLSATLNDMLARIERLMAGLREVSDNIAHDLRTPLSRIRARAEAAALATGTGQEAREAFEGIVAEADRLLATFAALLAIARLEAGSGRERFETTDLSELLGDLADLYEPAAREAGFAFCTDIAPNVSMAADRELLAQAVVNLIENALRYGIGHDAPALQLALQRRGGRIEITVADTGQGVPVEKREAVLDRFARLDETRSGPGAGLGLSLVRAIAVAHGGSVRLEDNAPGLRATLSFEAKPPAVGAGA
jgi:hypothetical protein